MNSDVSCFHDDVDALAEEIAVKAATMDSAMHGLLVLIRRFDEQKGWAHQGAQTCAHWLSWRIGDGLVAAREKVRVARALGALPLIDEAMRQGTISYSKARAMTRVATRDTEAVLVEFAKGSTGAQLDIICRGFRQVERQCESGRCAAASPADARWRLSLSRRVWPTPPSYAVAITTPSTSGDSNSRAMPMALSNSSTPPVVRSRPCPIRRIQLRSVRRTVSPLTAGRAFPIGMVGLSIGKRLSALWFIVRA